jgi:hypothetical protein
VTYVIFTTLTVHNTGANDEYLTAVIESTASATAPRGVGPTAGATATGTSTGAFHAASAATVEFLCMGSGGTSHDISDITMRVHFLG